MTSPATSAHVIPYPSAAIMPHGVQLRTCMTSSSGSTSAMIFIAANSPIEFSSFAYERVTSDGSPSTKASSPISDAAVSPAAASLQKVSYAYPLQVAFAGISSFATFDESGFFPTSCSGGGPVPMTDEVTAVVPVISTCSFSAVRVVGRGETTADGALAAKSSGFSECGFRGRNHLKNIGGFAPYSSQLFHAYSSIDPA